MMICGRQDSHMIDAVVSHNNSNIYFSFTITDSLQYFNAI